MTRKHKVFLRTKIAQRISAQRILTVSQGEQFQNRSVPQSICSLADFSRATIDQFLSARSGGTYA